MVYRGGKWWELNYGTNEGEGRWRWGRGVWGQVGGEGTVHMNEWMNRAGRGGGEVDAWSCRRQGGRQKTAELALCLYQLTAGWQKHTGHSDRQTQAHTPEHTQTEADHCADVQTLRTWKDTTEGREFEPHTETIRNLQMHKRTFCQADALAKRWQGDMLHKVHPPTPLRELTDGSVTCTCMCVWMFVSG